MSDTAQAAPDATRGDRWRAHTTVLAFGTFAVGTDAFVIAGLLPDISRSLHVTIAAAGQLVSVFSIAYALLSPVLAALTGKWSRRSVLVTALVVFAVGNVVTALAPSYPLVLTARVVAAAGAAMFTPNAGATAAAVAGAERRGRAIAIVTVGLTSSLALGAPLGTAIGNAWGWKATMWFVTALAIVVAPVIALRLPDVRLGAAPGLRQRLSPLTDRRVAGVLAGTLLAFIGIYLPYTYISSVFAPATGGDGGKVALLLLVFGIAGTAGNLTAGRLADRHGPRRVVVCATLGLGAVFLAMLAGRDWFPAAVLVVALGGIGSWSVTAPQQHRIIALAPAGAESLVVSLNAAVMYLAISLSSVIGAIGLDAFSSPAYLLPVATVFVVAAAALTWVTGRAGRRAADPAASAAERGRDEVGTAPAAR
ncbi:MULTISPECIES: MFS transporter [Streptomycetaceae]|uniref:Putative transmembrane efflux protein from the major facilitator superfamily n=1 Tax=Streptantibioticus cattleyicolor (strain ATCC 35852 / DSM 46488 / JCM 4925 / NBRC 14057 / NRRL 8057) TaxID=1003195 RepID=F8JRE5_STREN|nr:MULTISPECIES: MFS transporter [Streptomycetaceae]AEW96645.1 putative transmembrane efflux protein from the major facilitator superfamily [Streptantibioticus cattleyicolor NRRL 8057 = DSM 46488]MYS61138.1 MFS transporter [Streptomyces sp. SID5468]CCB76983.1 putative transmembrane efflux protein from the major facilitator superfamily [Streptantibioticus cattleyicolor NRRL 8057 = DSM 46488]